MTPGYQEQSIRLGAGQLYLRAFPRAGVWLGQCPDKTFGGQGRGDPIYYPIREGESFLSRSREGPRLGPMAWKEPLLESQSLPGRGGSEASASESQEARAEHGRDRPLSVTQPACPQQLLVHWWKGGSGPHLPLLLPTVTASPHMGHMLHSYLRY